MSRSVIVDDIDLSILYAGQWIASVLSPPAPTGLGQPRYTNTVHKITTAGSFEYTFRGSGIVVVGFTNYNGNPKPWNCAIDGNAIPNNADGVLNSTPPADPDASILCGKGFLTDSDLHTLNVTVNPQQGSTVYFDYIEYFPTQSTAFDDATVLIDYKDPEIMYDSEWGRVDALGRTTVGPNSSFNFTFEGVGLAMVGFHGNATSTSPIGNATYLIDNKNPVAIDLNPSNANKPMVLFGVPLTYGKHELTVVYQTGNTPSPPSFTLNALIVQNATAPNLSSATYNSPTTLSLVPATTVQVTPISSPDLLSTSSSGKPKLTPIAGGVVGGLVIFLALVLILAAFIFLRRQQENRKAKTSLLLLRTSMKSERTPHVDGTTSMHTHRPLSQQSDYGSSSSSLSYTSRSNYPHAQQADTPGYWDTVSFGRQTRGQSMATELGDGIADNGLLKRPDDPRPVGDSDAKAKGARAGLPSNPAVHLEAHRRALQQLLGIGSSTGPYDALKPVPEGSSRRESGRSRQSGMPSKPDVFEELTKESRPK